MLTTTSEDVRWTFDCWETIAAADRPVELTELPDDISRVTCRLLWECNPELVGEIRATALGDHLKVMTDRIEQLENEKQRHVDKLCRKLFSGESKDD